MDIRRNGRDARNVWGRFKRALREVLMELMSGDRPDAFSMMPLEYPTLDDGYDKHPLGVSIPVENGD